MNRPYNVIVKPPLASRNIIPFFGDARREMFLEEGGFDSGSYQLSAFPVVTLDSILADGTASSALGHCHSLPSLDSATGGGRVAPSSRFFAYFFAETRK